MAEGVGITVEVEDAPVRDMLARVAAIDGDTGDLMEDLAGAILFSTQRRFDTKTAPGGAPWARLAPRTARERIRKGYTAYDILVRRADLRRSIVSVVDEVSAEVGTNIVYGAIHQFGGTITAHHAARTQTIYQHYDARTDTLDQRFRTRERSNFARDVKVGAYETKTTIPARPYLGIDAADVATLVEVGDDWIARQVGGAR